MMKLRACVGDCAFWLMHDITKWQMRSFIENAYDEIEREVSHAHDMFILISMLNEKVRCESVTLE